MLQVNEIFGPTIQGEGAAAGRHCLFVRLANCNLECKWCDTAYTWAFTPKKANKLEKPVLHSKVDNIKQMNTMEVLRDLCKLWDFHEKPTMVVISGGEPLMQARELESLARELTLYGNRVHIETAATLLPTDQLHQYVDQYNVSPKLSHSGNRLTKRFKPDVLKYFGATPKAWFKFVVRNKQDFAEIDDMVKVAEVDPHRVMVMPEGVTAEQNLATAREIVDEAIHRGFGLSYRTHILLWKDVRGK